MYEPAQD